MLRRSFEGGEALGRASMKRTKLRRGSLLRTALRRGSVKPNVA